jgi:serine/threonine-protein kinase RsbT
MNVRSLSNAELKIDAEEDVVIVRKRVRTLAQEQKFDTFAVAAVTTAASELTRNVWVHARAGRAKIEVIADTQRIGLRVTFTDQGPGITDIERVMRGGYSTAKSLGLGLSGSKRLVDEFSIESSVGQGTVISFVKWKPF